MNAHQNNPMMGTGQPPMQNGFNPNNQVFNMFGGYQNFMTTLVCKNIEGLRRSWALFIFMERSL